MDAAIVDGTVHLTAMLHGMLAAGAWQDRRGANLLDGGCPFYGTYETSDGHHMAVGALEERFYAEFTALLGTEEPLPPRDDPARWPELRAAVAARFRTRTRAEWTEVFMRLRRLRGARPVAARGPGRPAPRRARYLHRPRRPHPVSPRAPFLRDPHGRPQRSRPARRRHGGRRPGLGPAAPHHRRPRPPHASRKVSP